VRTLIGQTLIPLQLNGDMVNPGLGKNGLGLLHCPFGISGLHVDGDEGPADGEHPDVQVMDIGHTFDGAELVV
jgi:hypothetical protein